MTHLFWLRLHTDDIVRFRVSVRRIIPALLTVYVIILFVFTVKLMGLPYLRLGAISNLDTLEKAEILEFVKIVFGFGIAEWFVTVLSLGLLLVWLIFAFLAWILLRLLLECIWQWFWPTDPDFFPMYCRITRFLYHALSRQNLIAQAICFLLAATILVKLKFWMVAPDKVAVIIGAILLCVVPYTYAIHWSWFFRILRRHPKAEHLNLYFFSQHSARRKLKNAVDMLVFLAMLTWVLLPIYFNACKGLSDKAAFAAREILDYKGRWIAISQKVIFASPGNERWMLPPPSQFAERLGFANMVRNAMPLTRGLPIFQKYLFAIVMFSTLFSLGIPAVYNVVREKGYRLAIGRVLFATVKTTIFLAILHIFVKKAYFIDMSEIIGTGAMFSFIIAVAISQDEKFYKKWKRGPIKHSATT